MSNFAYFEHFPTELHADLYCKLQESWYNYVFQDGCRYFIVENRMIVTNGGS